MFHRPSGANLKLRFGTRICYTPGKLGALRREELQRACARLGIGIVITPGLPDGGLDAIPDAEGRALVADELNRLGADVVLAGTAPLAPGGGGA